MINWGAANNGGFQNALAMGMQMGAQARQAREEREYKNALAQFDPSNPETLKPIMAARPEVGLQLRGQVQAQQAAAAEQDLTARALSDDPRISGPAMDELVRVNFDRWKELDERQQAAAAEETKKFGQVALSLSQIPYDQRRDQILALAQQMPQYADKIQEIAFLPQAEQDNILRVAITEAGLVERLIQYNQPETFNVGPGEGRYERDPRTGEIRTIVQPNYGQAPSFAPVPQGSGPALSDIEAELRRRGVM